jgi:hypothetical protein
VLRSDSASPRWLGPALAAGTGALAALLVALGNPGNMGICGACFLRDLGGTLGLASKGPRIFRPEVLGVMGGALAWVALRGRFQARSGSHAVTRFFFGVWMAFGALVFLGCPFRMLQRIGGGDANAFVGLPGFVLGVGFGLALEKRGYAPGKTAPAPPPVGLLSSSSSRAASSWGRARGTRRRRRTRTGPSRSRCRSRRARSSRPPASARSRRRGRCSGGRGGCSSARSRSSRATPSSRP